MTADVAGTRTIFHVRRDNLRNFRFETVAAAAPLAGGEVRLAIDAFAFTANNVTYAAFGEAMSYWSFFPAVLDGRARPIEGRVLTL